MINLETVDIITSSLNEEKCLPELLRRLQQVFDKEVGYRFRVICIDNGSTDKTWEIIESQVSESRNMLGVRLSRTFSLDSAFTCGLDLATGDLAIIMTSDLQDPPELIHDMLRKYEEGFDQVLVKITKRGTVPIVRRLASWAFYKLADRLTNGLLPRSVSDFRLMSRRAYRSVSQLRESHRFMRGLSSWVGFKSTIIEMERPPRFAGESKWLGTSFVGIIGHASRSIFAYSSQPLSWLSIVGLFSSFITGAIIFALIIFWWSGGEKPFAGFASLIMLILITFSILMLAIGVIAQYLSLMYEELKSRPLYIISETKTRS
jgi:dolichol-phosphate mannosyltransferase